MLGDYDLVVFGNTGAAQWAASTAVQQHLRVALVGEQSVPPLDPVLGLRQWAPAQKRVQALVAEQPAVGLATMGVDVIIGEPQIKHHRRGFAVQVGNRRVRSRHLLLATQPELLPPNNIPGLDVGAYLTPEQLPTTLQEQPHLRTAAWVVLGGGRTAVGISQALTSLGAQVTLITQQSTVLVDMDTEVAGLMQAQLEADGVRVWTAQSVTAVQQVDAQTYQMQTAIHAVNAQVIVWAPARGIRGKCAIAEALALQTTPQGLWVNSKMQTSLHHVYACGAILGGDVVPQVAQAEVRVILHNLRHWWSRTIDYSVIPCAACTQPQVAQVGLTEAQARQAYPLIQVWQDTSANDTAPLTNDNDHWGACKLIAQPNGKLLGAHLIGKAATELIHLLALALQKGCTIKDLEHLPWLPSTDATRLGQMIQDKTGAS